MDKLLMDQVDIGRDQDDAIHPHALEILDRADLVIDIMIRIDQDDRISFFLQIIVDACKQP